mgnify:CR=1 FL=1
MVSNVDTALLVMGLDDDFNPRRLERFLASCTGDAIVPVVVLTKVDVAAPTADVLDARLDALRGRIPAHIDVVAVNATHDHRRGGTARLSRARTNAGAAGIFRGGRGRR